MQYPEYAIPHDVYAETMLDGTPIVGYTDPKDTYGIPLPFFEYGPWPGRTPEQRAEFERGLELMARLGVEEW